MKKKEASQSAAIIAAHRAFESAKPPDKRICYDPYAEKLIGPGYTVVGKMDLPQQTALDLFCQAVPGFHEFFLARTRYIDDYLQEHLDQGLVQLVILGAGYDSRAYRFDVLKSRQVFEVDHAATLAVKKERVLEVFGELPDNVTYVPVDFQSQDLESCLVENGYDGARQTLFIWEGVTMYIDAFAVDKTLGMISLNTSRGSAVIFDYTLPEVIEGTEQSTEAKYWHLKAATSDEPLLFGIADKELENFLEKRGFTNVTQVSHTDFKAAYFKGQDRSSTPILSLAHARVNCE
jgi:methyltransferase (TIGR00027 family)